MRTWLTPIALGFVGCAGVTRPTVTDPVAHARLTVHGFVEASEVVETHLQAATAWAVFPDVEDAHEACIHQGTLFQPGAPPRQAILSCDVRPTAPAGIAYHMLVVLENPAELARLEEGGLELDGVLHLAPHDDHDAPAPSEGVWIVTSERGSLLFDAWTPRQTLTLARRE